MTGLPDGEKSFKIGLAVVIQYRHVTDTQPASHVAVASTRYAYLRRAVKRLQGVGPYCRPTLSRRARSYTACSLTKALLGYHQYGLNKSAHTGVQVAYIGLGLQPYDTYGPCTQHPYGRLAQLSGDVYE